jgi:cytochrome b6-f complex iron-sulfur subunit
VFSVQQSVSPPAASVETPRKVLPRRGLLRAALGSLLGLGLAAWGAATGLLAAAAARFLVPNLTNQPSHRFQVGLMRDFPPGSVETKYRQAHGVWLVHGTHRGQPRLFALRATCPHLGCMTRWDENRQRFLCPCHGSAFNKDGINLEGPAPHPLARVAIRAAEDGQLEIDLSRTFQEHLGQWSDPASFVTACP